ncbi:MAG: cob(I)yrinic acid a,c-diamide adenosyltransferase [Eubacteriales bacterium]
MIHIYCGDGKGKTTAACGLAVRAAGSGMKVLFVQFFKNGDSSEIRAMAKLENIDTCHPTLHYGRFKTMNDGQRAQIKDNYNEIMDSIIAQSTNYDLIVLDEAVSAYMYEAIEHEKLLDFLRREGGRREIVLTGRNPAPELIEEADYVTEMKKIKHPFDCGIAARLGIEY